jgi:hypothetical protein
MATITASVFTALDGVVDPGVGMALPVHQRGDGDCRGRYARRRHHALRPSDLRLHLFVHPAYTTPVCNGSRTCRSNELDEAVGAVGQQLRPRPRGRVAGSVVVGHGDREAQGFG